MSDDEFESRVLRFEQAWRRGHPVAPAAALDRPFELASAERRRLLIELIGIDLEFRGRSGESLDQFGLERYLPEFPEAASLDQLPLDLIAEEYRVRRRWGDRPSHAAFLSRFPARREEIAAALVRVDRELEDERASPRLPSASRRPEPGRLADHHAPGMPLLSQDDVLLRRLIGAGRMGKVYQAWQHSTGREIAAKFLRKTFLNQPEVVRRFIGEAETVARLRHPHIVGTHGLGRTNGGAYFIVMDLVLGLNLDEIRKSRAISADEVVRWAIEMGEALAHAHVMGVIHCDLKPANVLLDEGGRIRLTDFGLARSATEPAPWTAEIEGTAPFIAPEQVARTWGSIDPRTDVYGIGAVLFTLLTGRPPWVGRRLPDVLADVVSAAPVIPADHLRPDVPKPLADLCRTCLSKDPAGRYPSIQEVLSALRALGRDTGTSP